MEQNTLAEALRMQRARLGLTVNEAARILGMNRHTLRDLELGKRLPSGTTLAKLSEGYGVPISELLGEREPAGKGETPTGAGRGLGRTQNDLADLLLRAGAPTQHLADPGLFDALEGMEDEEFDAIVSELDAEVDVLAAEVRERLRSAAEPGSPSYMKAMQFWDKAGKLDIALRMFMRARKGVEPQEVEPWEVERGSQAIRELAGAVA
jgi:transcriptional regulator with XRE-family HTH domain